MLINSQDFATQVARIPVTYEYDQEIPPVSDPYERKTRIGASARTVDGKLITINTIDDELMRLAVPEDSKDVRRAKGALIRPDEPLFYLRCVQLNEPIKQALRKIARDKRLQAEVDALSNAVLSGQWDDPLLSHTEIRRRFPDEDPPIHIKDIAFYAYWKGALSRIEFHTVISKLNLAEQFGLEVPSRYVSKDETADLPVVQGDVKTLRLFDENKALTAEGENYLINVEKHAGLFSQVFEFDGAKLREKLRQMPQHMQVVFEVGNIAEIPDELKWAFGQYQSPIRDPLFNYKQSTEGRISFFSPSYGVIHEFIAVCASDAARRPLVQPLMCLGSPSSRTEGTLHGQGWHPVVAYDTRVDSNLVDIHYHPFGVHFGERHDSIFHTLYVSLVPKVDRDLCSAILPAWIDEIAETEPGFRHSAEWLIERIADMNMLDNRDGQFLRKFLGRNLRTLTLDDARDEAKKACSNIRNIYWFFLDFFHFFLKVVEKLIAEKDVHSKLPEPYKSALPCNLYELKLLIRALIKVSGGEKVFQAKLENKEPFSAREIALMKYFYADSSALDSQRVRELMESHPDSDIREWVKQQRRRPCLP